MNPNPSTPAPLPEVETPSANRWDDDGGHGLASAGTGGTDAARGQRAVDALAPAVSIPSAGTGDPARREKAADTLTTADGTRLYYKDWGTGRPVVFCHGWPLCSDSWEGQMMFLASEGYRCVAHDRRGHGRSSQPWKGNDMDHYADDLAELIVALDLRGITLVGFSAGGGEVVRYLERHGGERVEKVVLISAVPPFMLQTEANPDGVPMSRYDENRRASLADRAQLYRDIASGPFFGANRPGAKVSQGVMDSFCHQGMQAGLKNTHDCIKAFSETDFTEDLLSITQPTLLIHGDDDQIVPLEISSRRSAELIPNAKLHILLGGPHGLLDTHREQVNTLLLDFLKS